MARFLTEAHQAAYKHVARLMITLFGDKVEASMERTEFTVGLGSARVDVTVAPWRDDAMVTVGAVVLVQPRVDFDLMEFLLHENADFDIGSFGLSRGGNLVLRHGIMARSCDEQTLKTVVWTLMRMADQYDDRIQQRWGGQRAIDRPRTVSVVRTSDPGGASLADETVQFSRDDVGIDGRDS